MRFGSLFSGIGGFDLGFERAGMECAWQVEFDKDCQTILSKHFEGVEVYDDVKTVGRNELEPVDLICGGFPCQDISIAGKRAGLAGKRSGLWFEFARIIDELEPKWVVIENVAGLLSSNKGRDFAVIVQWLAERGYGVAWRVLDSQYFGVAQRRRRVFIVASFGSGSAAEVLFESESLPGYSQPSRKAGEEIARTIAISAGGDSGGQRCLAMASGQANAEILENKSPTLSLLHEQPIITTYNLHQNDDGRKDRPNGGLYVSEADKSLTLQAGQGKGRTLVLDESADTPAQFGGVWEMHHASEVYREGERELAPTLQARMGTGGNNVPLVGVRRLTPTECERLQGFPDGWTAGRVDTHRYKQLGNAVTVNVAEWIGKRIAEVVW